MFRNIGDQILLVKKLVAGTVLFLCLVSSPSTSSAQGGPIVDRAFGIALQARWTTTPGVAAVTWQVSPATIATGANDFELQIYVGGGQQWQHVWFTSEPSDNGNPSFLSIPDNFCLQIVATLNGSGPELGFGTSGNREPCAPPPPDTDGDGVPDHEDAFPNDPTEWADTDGDGVGDNADPDDDDDGLSDDDEITAGTDPANPDTDGDTHLDGSDNCPAVSNAAQADSDGDGIGDTCDDDLLKLLAGDGAALDRFGISVASAGDTVFVGADLDDDNGTSSGSVYVFKRDGVGVWTEAQKLTASDRSSFFGWRVAVDGGNAIITSHGDFDNGMNAGAVYIFSRDGSGNWAEQQKLKPNDGAPQDQFGTSVAISGDLAIVGAYRDDDNGDNSGSAYIFTRGEDGVWLQQQKLIASDGAVGDGFGIAVAVDGATAIVGAYLDDDNASDSGSVYVFTQGANGSWTERQKLTASDSVAGRWLGESVDLHGDTAMVGRRGGFIPGSTYVFARGQDGIWTETQKLSASGGAIANSFGGSVAFDANIAVIGAPEDDQNGTNSGIAYVFERQVGGLWTEQRVLLPNDIEARDSFGVSVAIGGDSAIVGSYRDDDKGTDSGSAYVYSIPLPDQDGDGVPDSADAFPNDPMEWLDTDSDGIGNNADTDDDNDGMPDPYENDNGFDPLDNSDAGADADADGYTNLAEYRRRSDPNDANSIPTITLPWLPILLE